MIDQHHTPPKGMNNPNTVGKVIYDAGAPKATNGGVSLETGFAKPGDPGKSPRAVSCNNKY